MGKACSKCYKLLCPLCIVWFTLCHECGTVPVWEKHKTCTDLVKLGLRNNMMGWGIPFG